MKKLLLATCVSLSAFLFCHCDPIKYTCEDIFLLYCQKVVACNHIEDQYQDDAITNCLNKHRDKENPCGEKTGTRFFINNPDKCPEQIEKLSCQDLTVYQLPPTC